MNASHLERLLRQYLNDALRRDLRMVSGAKITRVAGKPTGCCALGAFELAGHDFPLPEGARLAIADGWDGLNFDPDLHDGLDQWLALGRRLRKAYKPVPVERGAA